MDALFTAISMKGYDEVMNYDRFEMIGDTILKLLSTIEVFVENPQVTENDMHIKRSRLLNNINLFRQAMKYDLFLYILRIRRKMNTPITFTKKSTKKAAQGTQIESQP
mmetsp:Transcript_11035/g.9469  ORF Transcript_11035/g.9469 Transcript_11035/m.9469 type:complete len:108 (-) Transcript_11035:457-780(-)|eukprot:CAMPEP_0114583920 /NCGR_PEP_ID=MMETSP0125-20121206/7593_1 /TAXON_ID=485358 ORGANISM="Aristerostoma sp., Strain ATCC 50986" /NCGR_SAMPLE_ID=MMETSP0125 /ASSEMBLY_ACC=CAM_ASM_000245 /LENGTH=107 /DNA_ID=CAMNT_0001777739 /DNA_START=1292 /DNA_END=1615 /DNA_ORIENTATION=-